MLADSYSRALTHTFAAQMWTFGPDGQRCKSQVPDLWWHTQSYLIALWVCAAVTWCALAIIPSISITPVPRGGSAYQNTLE